jgi:hypothetical protein
VVEDILQMPRTLVELLVQLWGSCFFSTALKAARIFASSAVRFT